MKKTLLSLMLPLCIFTAKAQITVTDADIGAIGTSVIVLNDTNVSGLSVGNASTSASTWNFTGLTIHTKDTLHFIATSGTAGAAFFPMANMVIDDGENLTYLKKSSSQLAIDGTYGDFLDVGVNVPVNLKPDLTAMNFPSSLGSTYSGVSSIDSTVLNTFGVPLFDSLRVKRITDYSSNINAYGDLTTPSGTYSTIREYVLETSIDSIWGYNSFTGWTLVSNSTETTHNYNWLANGENYYVLRATADGPDGTMQTASYQIGANLIANTSSVDVTCNGGNDGSASAVAISGTAPYTYYWSNGYTTEDIYNLAAGTYTVTITDAISSTAVSTAIVNEPIMISISEDDKQHEYFGNDGFIDITVAGGTSPYQYNWSNGETTQDISGLAANTYTVTITDDNSCTETAEFIIDSFLSVEDLKDTDEITIYPNPTQGLVHFKGNVEELEIIDLSGRRVKSVKGNITSVNLSALSEGIYILKLNEGEKLQNIKLRLIK